MTTIPQARIPVSSVRRIWAAVLYVLHLPASRLIGLPRMDAQEDVLREEP